MSGRQQKLASRGTLHESIVEAFAAWAEANGYRREPVPLRAKYEMLRLRPAKGGQPILFFRREHENMFGGKPRHLTTTQAGQPLVRRWLAAKREEERGRAQAEAEATTDADAAEVSR